MTHTGYKYYNYCCYHNPNCFTSCCCSIYSCFFSLLLHLLLVFTLCCCSVYSCFILFCCSISSCFNPLLLHYFLMFLFSCCSIYTCFCSVAAVFTLVFILFCCSVYSCFWSLLLWYLLMFLPLVAASPGAPRPLAGLLHLGLTWSISRADTPSPPPNCVRLSRKRRSTRLNTPCRRSAC